MRVGVIATAAALVLAAPAFAQYPPPGPPPGPGAWDPGAFWRGAPDDPRQRIDFLQDRINRGMADGSLDPREARHANADLNGIRNWIHRLHWRDDGPLTPDQRGQVQARLDDLSRQIRWMRHNGW